LKVKLIIVDGTKIGRRLRPRKHLTAKKAKNPQRNEAVNASTSPSFRDIEEPASPTTTFKVVYPSVDMSDNAERIPKTSSPVAASADSSLDHASLTPEPAGNDKIIIIIIINQV
jgi:hypothetical protein